MNKINYETIEIYRFVLKQPFETTLGVITLWWIHLRSKASIKLLRTRLLSAQGYGIELRKVLKYI